MSQLGIRNLLSKIQLLGDILSRCTEMNNIINKSLLAGDKFIGGSQDLCVVLVEHLQKKKNKNVKIQRNRRPIKDLTMIGFLR